MSQDLGEIGSTESSIIEFTWHWYYALPVLIPWAILALSLVLPKANRDANSWQILIPIVNVYVLWRVILWLLPETLLPSSSSQQLDIFIVTLSLAFAVLWLLTGQQKPQHGLARTIKALAILGIMTIVSITCFTGSIDQEAILSGLILLFMELSFILSMVTVRRRCKGLYRPVVWTLSLIPFTLLYGIMSTLAFYTIVLLVLSSSMAGLTQVLIAGFIVGIAFGLILYVINLPFLLLSLISPFYRPRFQHYLGLMTKEQLDNVDYN